MATQNVITVGRRTHVIYDVPEVRVLEPTFTMQRAGQEICRAGVGPNNSLNVDILATGAWALVPFQDLPGYSQERNDVQDAVIALALWQLGTLVKSQNRWRNPALDLTGVTSGANVQDTGDPFLVKQVGASDTWDAGLSADQSSYGQPTLPTINIPMDRQGVTLAPMPANQAFKVRFEIPGTKLHSPDFVQSFYFGGKALPTGDGQFCVALAGDGTMYLWEKYKTGDGDEVWQQQDQWRYCSPQHVSDQPHELRIWPHRNPNGVGGYIEFRSGLNDSAAPAGTMVQGPMFSLPSSARAHVSNVTYWPQERMDVFGPGPLRFDMRRDLRPRVQFARLTYPPNGILKDLPFNIPFFKRTELLLTLTWTADVPDGATLTGTIYDANTQVVLGQVDGGDKFGVFTPNANQSTYYVHFEFTSNTDGSKTPLLWSYEVKRNAYGKSTNLNPYEGGQLLRVSITGPESDPSHETGSITVADRYAQLNALKLRSMIPVRVETEYDQGNPALRSVLLRGYIMRADAEQHGTNASRPVPYWNQYELTIMGMWTRLHQSLFFGRKALFETTPIDPTGQLLPLKVTDVIRQVLNGAGFTEGQIDVPDSDIRFFPSQHEGQDENQITPLTNIAEWVIKAAQDYLGWYLIFDANAGFEGGQWRIRQPPLPPYTNLATFYTSVPGTGGVKIPTYPGACPDGTFIRKGTLKTYVKAPEGNAVLVTGTGILLPNKAGQFQLHQYLVNEDGLNNPLSPDYLPNFVPIVVVNTALTTQPAVDFFARRVYDFATHAIKMAPFEAPLLLVVDPLDTEQTAPRPLRYYDPVLMNQRGNLSQWLVRSCTPTYQSPGGDRVQMARYELETPRIGL